MMAGVDANNPVDTLTTVDGESRVQADLAARGLNWQVVRYPATTATAEQAAAAVGCATGQIVKTLCFLASGRPTLVLVGGDRQVDTSRLAAILGVSRKKLRMGSPAEVLEATGYPIGGVSPFGATTRCDVVADEDLRTYAEVWVAAGSPHAVFRAEVEQLGEALGVQWAAIGRGESDA